MNRTECNGNYSTRHTDHIVRHAEIGNWQIHYQCFCIKDKYFFLNILYHIRLQTIKIQKNIKQKILLKTLIFCCQYKNLRVSETPEQVKRSELSICMLYERHLNWNDRRINIKSMVNIWRVFIPFQISIFNSEIYWIWTLWV